MGIFNRLFGKSRHTGSGQNKISTFETSAQKATEYYNRGVQSMHSGDWEKALEALAASDQEPLDVCTTSFSAEDARGDGSDEPCDDGRAG